MNINDYFKNKAGAIVPYDTNKIPFLSIENEVKALVLSVGAIEVNHLTIPIVTIKEPKGPICYRIPNEYEDWAKTCMGFSAMNLNMFPAEVIFTKQDGKYFADIL